MNDGARAAHLAGLAALSLLLGAAMFAGQTSVAFVSSRTESAPGRTSDASAAAELLGLIAAAKLAPSS